MSILLSMLPPPVLVLLDVDGTEPAVQRTLVRPWGSRRSSGRQTDTGSNPHRLAMDLHMYVRALTFRSPAGFLSACPLEWFASTDSPSDRLVYVHGLTFR